MKRRLLIGAALSALALTFTFPLTTPLKAQDQPIVVFAAASLKNALDQIAAEWMKESGNRVKFSYAASGVLAKQVENGAPADIFISADLRWMDYVADKKLVKTGTRVNIASNELVVIAKKGSKSEKLEFKPGFDFAARLGNERVAVGAIATTPAGQYTKEALTAIGNWQAVEKKLAEGETVWAALAFVQKGEVPYGILFRTDAITAADIEIVAAIPTNLHKPIIYPAAIVETSKNPKAASFISMLQSKKSLDILQKHGFVTLVTTPSN